MKTTLRRTASKARRRKIQKKDEKPRMVGGDRKEKRLAMGRHRGKEKRVRW